MSPLRSWRFLLCVFSGMFIGFFVGSIVVPYSGRAGFLGMIACSVPAAAIGVALEIRRDRSRKDSSGSDLAILGCAALIIGTILTAVDEVPKIRLGLKFEDEVRMLGRLGLTEIHVVSAAGIACVVPGVITDKNRLALVSRSLQKNRLYETSHDTPWGQLSIILVTTTGEWRFRCILLSDDPDSLYLVRQEDELDENVVRVPNMLEGMRMPIPPPTQE
jgi:hypothetical protein